MWLKEHIHIARGQGRQETPAGFNWDLSSNTDCLYGVTSWTEWTVSLAFILSCFLCTCESWCLLSRVQEASSWVVLVRSRVVWVCSLGLMGPKSMLGTLRVTVGPYLAPPNDSNVTKIDCQCATVMHLCCVVQSYFEGDFYSQSDRLMVVLYVANQSGHDLLCFPSSHNKTEVKTFILLWMQPSKEVSIQKTKKI